MTLFNFKLLMNMRIKYIKCRYLQKLICSDNVGFDWMACQAYPFE